MPLPAFNLSGSIETYNKKEKCNYAPDEDFDFYFFKKEIISQTRAAIAAANMGFERYQWTPAEKEFLKKRKQYIEQYQLFLKNSAIKPEHAFLEDVSIAWSVQKKVRFWHWVNTWITQLSKPETWETWINGASNSNKTQLLQLKQQWEGNSYFAHHTHKSIYVVAKKLLPSLIEFHKKAYRQLFLNFWKLPNDIFSTYKKYIESLLEESKRMKPLLAANILFRLEAWDKNRFSEGNPLVYFHQELQKLNVLSKQEKLEVPYEALSTKQFNFFHSYIERYGNEETKKRLKSLSWFSNENTACRTCYVQTKVNAFLVPEEFYKEVPIKLGNPAWLNHGHNLRHTFFQAKSLLLVSLKSFPSLSNISINLSDLSNVNLLLNDLNHKQLELYQALNDLEDPVYKELGYFQNQAKQFIQKWKVYLLNYHTRIIEGKLEIAEKITAELQSCDSMQSTLQVWSACVFINKLVKSLHDDLREYPNVFLQQRLVQIKTKLIKIQSNYQILQLIQKIASGKIITQEKLSYLLDVTKTIQLNDKAMYTSFQEICQPQFVNMQKLLDYELKSSLHTLNNPKDHANRVLTIKVVLEACGEKKLFQATKQRISDKLPKYFLKYLEVLLRCGQQGSDFTRYQQAIEASEQIILALDNEILFANKTLSTHVNELKKLREEAINKSGSWVLVYARAQALAKGLLSVYLDSRIKKDLASFDQQLFEFIKNDTELPFDENTVKEIQKISDQQIEQNVSSIEDLSLAPEQKTIVGLHGGSSAYIRDLLELRQQVHLKNKLLKEFIPIREKTQLVQSLAMDVKNTLQNNTKPFTHTLIGYTRSGRRGLFTKNYFDVQLLDAGINSNTASSTISLIKQ